MSDELTTTITADAAGGDAQNSGDGGEQAVTQAPAITFATEQEFQAKVDGMLKERLERAQRKADEATAKARTEAERKAAEEQGRYKELADSLRAELEAERGRAKALEMAALKRQVAEKVGIPPALADRLQGDDAEALEDDARAVLAALPKPAAPNINAAPGASAAPPNGKYGGLSEQEFAAVFGVNPKYINQ